LGGIRLRRTTIVAELNVGYASNTRRYDRSLATSAATRSLRARWVSASHFGPPAEWWNPRRSITLKLVSKKTSLAPDESLRESLER
jgi:hypothetical protein